MGTAPTRPHTTPPPAADNERGSVVWAVIVSLVLLGLAVMFTNSVITTAQRSVQSTNQIAVTQRTDAAVADAVARLSSGASVPATRADAIPSCQVISKRNVCFQYWALPVPGNAVDPVRYNLVTNTWIDVDGSSTRPVAGKGVRAVLMPLEAITYQSAAGLAPVSVNGQIQYNATPAGLFNNALHAFGNVTLTGPDVSIESYNSATGANGTKRGVVSSGEFVSYGRATKSDSTVLYGYRGAGGATTTRCTGEACAESDVQSLTQSYARAGEPAVEWIRGSTACTTRVEGDWVASQNAGKLPGGVLCVKGSMIIDAATSLTTASSSVYVDGNLEVTASLNAPQTGRVATPGRLAIYAAGQGVSFAGAESASPGTGIAAMIWAPRAVCSTDPASSKEDDSHLGQVVYFGSLVCDTVSIGGSWRHLVDDAQTVTYRDPVPGAKKSWTVGNPQVIDTGEEWDIPVGWQESVCVVPSPVDAASYWKLSEPSGLLAADSAGSNDLGWNGSTTGRGEGLCGRGAAMTPFTGAAAGGANIVSATEGISIEWWGKATVGTVVNAGGISLRMGTDRRLMVTSDGALGLFAFTVQNASSWHLYTVTVSHTGDAALYVDGVLKETAKVKSPSAGGPTLLAQGVTGGVINDVVVYRRTLEPAEVSDRWTTWNANVVFTASDPGTPFTAPTGVRDDGTSPTLLKIAWNAATGTLPAAESTYVVQRSATATGTFSEIGRVPIDALTFELPNPTAGDLFYRVCTSYNGDVRCSEPVNILTLPEPEAPSPVSFVANDATSKFLLSWDPVPFAQRYEVQYILHGQSVWSGAGGVADAVYDYGTQTSISPSYQAGRSWSARVRTVNARGTSPWSTPVSAQAAPAVPTASFSNPTNTGIQMNWAPSAGVVDGFEYQLIIVNAPGWVNAWMGPSNVVGTVYTAAGTSRNRSLTSAQHGTIWRAQVRAVSGTKKSAWSTMAQGNQTVGAGTPYGQHFTGRGTDNRTFTNMLVTCPAGTFPYTRYQNRLSSWGYWNPFSGWMTSPEAGLTASAEHGSWGIPVGNADSLVINNEIACRNNDSGISGPVVARQLVLSPATSAGWANAVDSVVGAKNALTTRGWAFQVNNPAASTTLHVYADAYTANSRSMACRATDLRQDVKNAYPQTTAYQGFNCTLSGIPSGARAFTIFAIDQYGNGTSFGSRTVNVS